MSFIFMTTRQNVWQNVKNNRDKTLYQCPLDVKEVTVRS